MMLSAKLVGCLARAPLCYSPQGWRGTAAGQPTLTTRIDLGSLCEPPSALISSDGAHAKTQPRCPAVGRLSSVFRRSMRRAHIRSGRGHWRPRGPDVVLGFGISRVAGM